MYTMPNRTPDYTYNNINQCFNIKFDLLGATTYVKPTSAVKCSEVVLLNNTGGDITFKAGRGDLGNPADITEFVVSDNQEFTVRGITNTEQLSCAGTNATTLYGRSQWYSLTPQSSY